LQGESGILYKALHNNILGIKFHLAKFPFSIESIPVSRQDFAAVNNNSQMHKLAQA
jgi:hypothetical protein